MSPKGFKYFLLFFALLGIFPLVQNLFKPFKLVGLDGAFITQEQPLFSIDNFWSGKFQQTTDIYVNDNAPFRGDLVRLRNQLDYFAFGNINTILTLGKENYIFDPNYIWALEGKDLLADSILQQNSSDFKMGMKVLNDLKIPLIFCFAPNKANYYKEFLPEALLLSNKTNQLYFDSMLRKNQIPVFDAGSWFNQLKNKTPYPLIPKYGAHWSIYGASLVADSLMEILGSIKKKQYVQITQSGIETSTKARFTDDDYLASLNLIWKWSSPPMSYPQLKFTSGLRPDLLIVSDSYFWSLYELEIVQNCFAPQSQMWYYNRSVYDTGRNKIADRSNTINLSDLKNRDAIIIVAAGPSLKDFAYGFFHQLAFMKTNEK